MTPTNNLPAKPIQINWIFLCLGVLACLALTEINARILGIFAPEVHETIQMLLLITGAICICIGFTGIPRRFSVDRREAWTLLLLVLVALFLRVWQLDTAVSVPMADEYVFIDTAIALWDKPDFPMLEPFDAGFAFTWTHPYIILASMETFGWGVFAARLPSAFVGSLTVIACYFLAKYLFDCRIALISAIILATFPPHIHVSRLAMTNVFDPFFGTLALAMLVRGVKYKDIRSFALAGVALGLTQYFHEAGRLLFPLVVFSWLLVSSLYKPLVLQRKELMRRLFYVFIPFFLLALPIYITLIALDYPLFSRLEWVAPGGERNAEVLIRTNPKNILSDNYLDRLGGVLLHFVSRLDNSPDFYGGSQPMILNIVAAIFLLGVGVMLFKIRDKSYQFIIIWMLGAIFGIAIVRIGAWTIRFAPIFPAISIVIAIGVSKIANAVASKIKTRYVLIILTVAIAIGQSYYYFVPHLNYYNRQVRWQTDFADAFHRSIDLPLNTKINFIDEEGVWMAYIRILMRLWHRTDLEVIHYPVEDFDLSAARTLESDGLSQVFFVNPEDDETVDILRQVFNLAGPEFSPYLDVPLDLQYALYYVTNP